jgi:hypothetical protein
VEILRWVKPPPPQELVDRMRELGPKALGRKWVYRLAKSLGVAIRTAQRWNNGTYPVPDDALRWLEEQAALRERSGIDAGLEKLIAKARAAGLSPEAIASALRDEADELTKGHRKTEQ